MKDLNHFQFRGKRGKRNQLIIGLYAVDNDDFISRITLQNTDAIAKEEAYDGWIRASLCPLIESRKLDSDDVVYPSLIHYNFSLLRDLLGQKEINIQDVWLMCGDGVGNKNRRYLKVAIGYLYGALLEYNLRYWCISRTRFANPRDTSPVTLKGVIPEIEPGNFIKFDFQHCVHYRKLSLRHENMIKSLA